MIQTDFSCNNEALSDCLLYREWLCDNVASLELRYLSLGAIS